MKAPKTKEQIEKLFDKISDKKKEEAEILSSQMFFVIDTLEQLKEEIKQKGVTEHFEQGKQNFIRESPALKSYIQLMKTYDSLYKNIINLIKESDSYSFLDDEDFEDYLKD